MAPSPSFFASCAILIAFNLLPSVNSLSCYTCSAEEKNCTLFENFRESKCEEDIKYCSKLVLFNSETGEREITRDCTFQPNSELGCSGTEDNMNCNCDTDYCNEAAAAIGGAINKVLWASATLLLTRLL